MATSSRPWFRKSKGRWFVTLDGKQISLGIPDPHDEAAAWSALHRLLATGSVTLSVPPAETGAKSVPVADAVSAWLSESCEGVQPATALIYRKHAASFGKSFAGRAVDGALTAKEVRDSSCRPGWSDSYRRQYLDVATSILRSAKWPHELKKKPRKVSAGSACLLSAEQHQLILDTVRGDMVPYLRVQWELGSRPQELAGLELAAVKWADGIAVLTEHKNAGKTGKPRTLYFSAVALAILERQRARYGAGLAFRGSRGQLIDDQAMCKRLWRASKVLGFRVTAYHYRHTFITRMLLRGITAAQVAELCGTSVDMIARHYGHLESVQGLREVLLKAAG